VNAEKRKSLGGAAARLLLLCALIDVLVLKRVDGVLWAMLGIVAFEFLILYVNAAASGN
jgi:hypothetical protein